MLIRVHELAKELGCTSKEVLLACSELGEFVKSSSSTLSPRVAQIVREKLDTDVNRLNVADYGASLGGSRSAAASDDGGFGAAFARARRASRRPTSASRSPGEIQIAIYRYAIEPRRSRRGSYTPEEQDRAERLTERWVLTWLPDVVEWIQVAEAERPDIAVKLAESGLCPADADLRLGFGRIDTNSDTMYRRLVRGIIGIKDAVQQVQGFRRTEQNMGT
ncbi:translation initiation factor IF-2 N-terminal domain-containing protein [Mycobacterium sp. M1]|uniref:Translation initiation factor IF-2 N-terminal domain-containing protein n=1 Tax=Mycolicibacter acidiphilus TaxID=2835306 RepID=A0ABS5RQU5_9MYCO|nr:translation initiation factor IF-2 N-terminal domain-containing protein [Mycolicibacter acidiphilus]MBS9535943.1 translation initiation factor IF-2 N-terminal domain-containing protein [Mycolicibacter acidiphilus]